MLGQNLIGQNVQGTVFFFTITQGVLRCRAFNNALIEISFRLPDGLPVLDLMLDITV